MRMHDPKREEVMVFFEEAFGNETAWQENHPGRREDGKGKWSCPGSS